MDPAEYPARVTRQRVPPVSQQSPPVDPAEYPAEYPLPVDPAEYPASIEPERLASIRQWTRPVSRQPEQLASLVLLNVPPGAQLGLHFMLVPSGFECTLRLGKGDAFVLLWVVSKQLRFIPCRVSFWKGLGFC